MTEEREFGLWDVVTCSQLTTASETKMVIMEWQDPNSDEDVIAICIGFDDNSTPFKVSLPLCLLEHST